MLLLSIVSLGVLIAILVKMGSTSGEIEVLKRRISQLEDQLQKLGRSSVPPPETKAQPQAEDKVMVSGPKMVPTPPPIPLEVPVPPKQAQVSQPPSPPQATQPPDPPKPVRPPLSTFLRNIGLWPPERNERSSELVLMQWWAPRIGGGLAILSIIFFAVYVAQGTPPWVKFAEMLAASLGVFGLGLFFTRKRPGLGNVLVATGLSMIYISSVAGYAVGPVKVVENPLIGAIMQLSALVLIFGIGAWKKERAILILAIVFGYMSSLFAALEGFREAALISSLLIYLAGLFAYRRIGGLTLASLALAGVYLPLAGFVGIKFYKAAAVYPAFWSVIVFLVITVSILPACQRWMKGAPFLEPRWNRLYQALNTSFALGLGFVFVAYFYAFGKTEFYGVLSLIFILWSFVWLFRDIKGIEFHLFFLKGSALASLWVINYLHGDLRWMALGVQVVILAASVHRSKSVWVEAITFLTWVGSFWFFAPELDAVEAEWTFLWFVQGAYILVSVGGLGYLQAYAKDNFQIIRTIIYSLPALVLAVASCVFAVKSRVFGLDEPASLAIMAFLLLLVGAIPGVQPWISIVAGALVFFTAHARFWIDPSGWSTLLVVLAVTACCLIGLFRAKTKRKNLVEFCIHALWVLTLAHYLESYGSLPVYPLVVAVFSWLLFLAGGLTPLKRLTETCAIPLLVLMTYEPNASNYPGLGLFMFALLLGFLANALFVWPPVKDWVHYLKRGQIFWWVLQTLFFFWAYWALEGSLGLTNQLLVWSLLGVVYFTIWYWRRNVISLVGALGFAALPVLRIVDLWLNPVSGGLLAGAPWAAHVLLAGLISTFVWVGYGMYSTIRVHDKLPEKLQNGLAWVCAILAYAVFAAAFAYPLLNWDRFYTPLLAAFSIGLIVLGIIIKSRPYRYVAMLTFLVPLFRLFVYDIREMLYRIIAFAVLAVVLTVVGFLYQKFSSRIE